jgi:hypothetical protein
MRRITLLLATMALSLLVADGVAQAGSSECRRRGRRSRARIDGNPYTMTPFGPDARHIAFESVPVTDVPAPAGAAGALQFDRTMRLWRVIDLDGWGNGYTGDAYSPGDPSDQDRVVMTLPANTQAFTSMPNPTTSPFPFTT